MFKNNFPSARGAYYLETNSGFPFGRGQDGQKYNKGVSIHEFFNFEGIQRKRNDIHRDFVDMSRKSGRRMLIDRNEEYSEENQICSDEDEIEMEEKEEYDCNK